MPTKRTTNKLSQLYKTIDQKELSADAKKALADLRIATGNFRKKEGKEADAFMLFYNRLVNKKPTAVKTTKEYKAMLTERRRENGRKAMEARKAKQESRQGQGSERDAARPAKPFGWRLKGKHNYRKPTREDIRTGKAYYEARINRADSKRTKFPMLERGGYMAKGGKMGEFRLDFVPQTTLGGKSIATRKDIEMFKKNTVDNPVLGEYVEKFNYDFQNEMGYLILNDESRVGIFITVLDSFNLKPSPYQKFEHGGAIENQYEGRTPEDIWNSYSKDQRLHFLYDHSEEINEYKAIESEDEKPWFNVAYKSNWDDLDMDVKNRFANHVRGGQYANGGEVDKGGMIYALRNEISGGTIANKSGVDTYDDIAKVRRIAIQYYVDNGDAPYSLGELDRVLARVGEEMRTKMAKGGEIKYSTYDNKSMEYIEGEIAHTERSARQFQQMGDYESMKDRQEHVKKLREIYNKKRAESKMAKGGVFYTDSHKRGH